jgi:hypothetical protein
LGTGPCSYHRRMFWGAEGRAPPPKKIILHPPPPEI